MVIVPLPVAVGVPLITRSGRVKGDASWQDALDGVGGLGSAVGLWHGDCRDRRSHFPRLGIAGIVGE